MSAPHSPPPFAAASPRKRTRGAWPALLLAGLLCADVAASDPFVLVLDDLGRISVAGTPLERLSGKYDPKNFKKPQGENRWMAFAVAGADRWALRLDGLLEKNGVPLAEVLPFEAAPFPILWRRLAVAEDQAWALRSDGLLGCDGLVVGQLPRGPFHFSDLLAFAGEEPGEPMVVSLRGDGAVFVGACPEPRYRLEGGPALFGAKDGGMVHTTWLRLARDPVSGEVLALRADGRVIAFDPAGDTFPECDPEEPPEPFVVDELKARLPFRKRLPLRFRDLYVDLDVLADGALIVLRTDGRIYRCDEATCELPTGTPPFTKLPAAAYRPSGRYVDLAAHGDSFYALRRDGRVFRDGPGNPDDPGGPEGRLFVLPGARWTGLHLSDAAPDLTFAQRHPPLLSRWRARTVQGEPIVLPVLANDVDTASDDLLVTVDFSQAPGAVFDAGAGEVVFDAVALGRQIARVTVDDGQTPPVTRIFDLRVLPADGKAVNRRPEVSRPGPVGALVGRPLAVPILAADRDGDELSITPREDRGVFLLGATFDAETGVLHWTPGLSHVGRQSAAFLVSDGQATRLLRLRLLVRAGLLP